MLIARKICQLDLRSNQKEFPTNPIITLFDIDVHPLLQAQEVGYPRLQEHGQSTLNDKMLAMQMHQVIE